MLVAHLLRLSIIGVIGDTVQAVTVIRSFLWLQQGSTQTTRCMRYKLVTNHCYGPVNVNLADLDLPTGLDIAFYLNASDVGAADGVILVHFQAA